MIALNCLRGAAVAICLAVSVTAGAQDRVPVTARVGYADLDLATVPGQAAFKQRIHRAASETCVSVAVGLYAAIDRSRCMREMERDGDTRLAMLVAAPKTQLASIGDTARPGK